MKEHAQAVSNFLQVTSTCHLGAGISRCCADKQAEALDRAGLLRTGLEKRAIEACERRAKWDGVIEGGLGPDFDAAVDASRQVIEVGRASLAAKKPKPRWIASPPDDCAGQHTVRDTQRKDRMWLWVNTHAEARAIADALNALEEK